MKILYFALVARTPQQGRGRRHPAPEVTTIANLLDWLADHDEAAATALEKRSLIKAAINAKLVQHDASLAGAHTVALFPP
ncbi:MoaD/ThiS family protein [Devosia sp. A8/3-2]|nr:MoaD/ThiS family protein [Devosia sp. A8/3-2]